VSDVNSELFISKNNKAGNLLRIKQTQGAGSKKYPTSMKINASGDILI
jgi:hypothetical protein